MGSADELAIDHLCVLVHGLGGGPEDLRHIRRTLCDKYPASQVFLLVSKSNAGSLSYDGIDRGGERVCAEIESQLREMEKKGGPVKKLSLVGYSLGGLVLRYAAGLLHARKVLQNLQCMASSLSAATNFTTFASPHVGVRDVSNAYFRSIWNGVGARALSASGRQLFLIDKFRDTGRPLLAILADPDFVFQPALQKFQRRSLYANIANDQYTAYYTSSIQDMCQYHDLRHVEGNFVEGYVEAVLNPERPLRPKTGKAKVSAATTAVGWAKHIGALLTIPVYFCVGVVAFLANSAAQTVLGSYRAKFNRLEQASASVVQLRSPEENKAVVPPAAHGLLAGKLSDGLPKSGPGQCGEAALNLTLDQAKMIWSLNSLGWRKYPVWIQKTKHSHSAIIACKDGPCFSEGRSVLSHYVNKEFLA